MIICLNIIAELSRANKVEQFNCYTSLADINLYADTQQIVVTVQSTRNSACDIPHGIKVTLQIDVLGLYEPYVYVRDYDYISTTTILMKCTDASCSTISDSASGIIYIESKTKVTKIPAGSVRISRGIADNCFQDNETNVELQQGAVVLNTYANYNCLNDIANFNGVWTLKPVNHVKLYITYSDESITIHQGLTVEILDDLIVPTTAVTALSVPIRIRLSDQYISNYFNQSIVNGKVSKDTKFFIFNIQFIIDELQPTPLLKTVQVTANLYVLTGFPNTYTLLTLQVLDNGFFVQRALGPDVPTYNSQIIALGTTSYIVEYIFTPLDNRKTKDFRMKLASTSISLLFANTPVQSTCETRFPNQNCSLLIQKLKQMDTTQVNMYLSYYFYAGSTVVANYTRAITAYSDSCFSTGQLSYSNDTQTLIIIVNMNDASETCQLVKNDQITIKILLANTSTNVLISTQVLDFNPGVQNYQVSNVVIVGSPEIRIHYLREGEYLDAISLNQYEMQANNDLFMQHVYITMKILAVQFAFVLVYCIWLFAIYPLIQKRFFSKPQKSRQLIPEDEGEF
ncbi:Conserved_hypothetical protein [Hexamita inflata]|uniref:Uncharacterized protein n=1 Tax=Hexamita inflata TaxID=28002 RepID=A0AA86UU54_9EUKA|nr:Conserved hypothetical protein [Hexamita inflata]